MIRSKNLCVVFVVLSNFAFLISDFIKKIIINFKMVFFAHVSKYFGTFYSKCILPPILNHQN